MSRIQCSQRKRRNRIWNCSNLASCKSNFSLLYSTVLNRTPNMFCFVKNVLVLSDEDQIYNVSADAKTTVETDYKQARNQLGTPGGAKSFPRGAKSFWTMSNVFKLCPKHFSRGGEKFLGRASSPLRPPCASPGYGPDHKPNVGKMFRNCNATNHRWLPITYKKRSI